jgi:hypothetical protein
MMVTFGRADLPPPAAHRADTFARSYQHAETDFN